METLFLGGYVPAPLSPVAGGDPWVAAFGLIWILALAVAIVGALVYFNEPVLKQAETEAPYEELPKAA